MRGKVSILYPSDLMLGMSGGDETRTNCLNSAFNLETLPLSCITSNYLSRGNHWTLAIYSGNSYIGIVSNWGGAVGYAYPIYPTLYLKTDTIVLSNEIGSRENPYILA